METCLQLSKEDAEEMRSMDFQSRSDCIDERLLVKDDVRDDYFLPGTNPSAHDEKFIKRNYWSGKRTRETPETPLDSFLQSLHRYQGCCEEDHP